MEVIKTAIEGVVIIEPRIFKDARGYFFESFSQREFEEKVGPIKFVQDNESMSSYGVMRGLHFQRPPYTQSKLVRCVKGAVLDVAVDLRKGSPTYGQHVAVELTEDNHKQFFIPKGFAHGFAVLSETAVFQYKCDEFTVENLNLPDVFSENTNGMLTLIPGEFDTDGFFICRMRRNG